MHRRRSPKKHPSEQARVQPFRFSRNPPPLSPRLSSSSSPPQSGGQLETILCSFPAQTRASQGPLIKDEPSSSLSASFLLSLSPSLFLSAPPPIFIILSLSFFSSSLPSNLFPSPPPSQALSRSSRLSPSSSYLSRSRFDIHIGTVFRVNLCKQPDLLFSFCRC